MSAKTSAQEITLPRQPFRRRLRRGVAISTPVCIGERGITIVLRQMFCRISIDALLPKLGLYPEGTIALPRSMPRQHLRKPAITLVALARKLFDDV